MKKNILCKISLHKYKKCTSISKFCVRCNKLKMTGKVWEKVY